MKQIENQETMILRSEYAINSFKIDNKHQKLFLIVREGLNISKQNHLDNTTKRKEVIVKLFEYVDLYFEHKEEYMELKQI